MPPKKGAKGKKEVKKIYDYSGLEKGMKVQAECEGTYYAAEVVTVATGKSRAKAPVKVSFNGYDKSWDTWVSGDQMRSKALKVSKPEPEKKAERPPLEINFGYWAIRGLGAVFRMVFEYKGVKYTDNQYSDGAKWFGEDKPKILAENPLANLPYLQCGKDTVCQTNACLSYLGRRLRLNGLGYKAQLKNEELLCEIYDTRNSIIELSYPYRGVARDEKEHNEKAKKALEGGPFAKYEAVLEKGGTDYFCGKTPCVCDFHIWEMMDQWSMLGKKHGMSNLLDSTPKCKAFYDRFRALPTLQKYFESDSYKLPCNNASAPNGVWFK